MSNQEAQKLTQSANILTAIKDRSTVIHNKVWNTAWRLSAIYSLFLASCGPKPETTNQPEALPTNTGEPPQVEFSPTLEEIILTPTSTLEPTTIPTETPTPTETIALPPPTETWMGEFLANKEGYDYSFENGQWLMRSKPLTNGKTIDMFTFADGEWQPTYDTLPNHVNEYFGLDLEAVAHQFVRYELTTDNRGNSIRTLNPDDLANLRALAETRWEERKEHLAPFGLRVDTTATKSSISNDGLIIFDKSEKNKNNLIADDSGRWEVLSAASTGHQGKDQIVFIGTKQGLIPIIIIKNSGIIRTFPGGKTAESVENSTNGLIENPDLIEKHRFVFSAPSSDSVNLNSVYTYSQESLDYYLSFVRGVSDIVPHLKELAESGYFVELENIIKIIDQNNIMFVPSYSYSELN